MKQLIKPDPIVMKMIEGSALSDGTILFKSHFIYEYKSENRTVCHNTLTKETILLDQDEEIPKKTEYDGSNKLMAYLSQHHFLVRNQDEYKTYFGLISALRALNRKEGISLYTILPTTYCNARCFYCYEKDFHFTAMSAETEQKLIEYILATHNKDKFRISWFGGEPLLGLNTIRRVSSVLNENGLHFSSSMVSNGSLFNKALAEEAVKDWHLENIQITLDGTENEYHKRKQYYDTEKGSLFRRVLDNIHLLLNAGIQVKIRLNVDSDNLPDIRRLIDQLKEEFEQRELISVYTHPLFHEERSVRCSEIWNECIYLNNLLNKFGLHMSSKSETGRLNLYYCKAANPGAVVIDPSGNLYACEHCAEDSCLGSIQAGYHSDYQRSISSADLLREKCKNCRFLPICTDFSMCPTIPYNCQEKERIKIQNKLELMNQ